MHTPWQRVWKSIQSVPCIATKWWCGSHISLPKWYSSFRNMKWGWIDSDISDILSYGKENTKGLVSPWGYRARVGKGWEAGKNWWA